LALKFFYYFIVLFFSVMFFLIFQKPYDIQVSQTSKSEPSIEMFDVVNYSISEDGILHIAKATKVSRFLEYDKFYNIDSVRRSKDNFFENLKADSAKLKKDNLSFEGSVFYKNSNSVKFRTEKIDYNLKTRVAKTDVDFILEDNRTVTHGASLVYNTIESKIYATNIKLTVEEE